jgi:hypothetical protein
MVDRCASLARLALLDMPSAGSPVSRHDYGGQDVSDAAPKPCGAAAFRMRNHRSRRRDGMRVIPFEVRNSEIDDLIAMKLLDPEWRNDRVVIARAFGNLLDQIPVARGGRKLSGYGRCRERNRQSRRMLDTLRATGNSWNRYACVRVLFSKLGVQARIPRSSRRCQGV